MSQFVKGSVGTTQMSHDDVTTTPTRIFQNVTYTNDYAEAKIVTYRAQDRGGGVYAFDITTNAEENLDLSEAFVTYNLKLKNPGGETCKYDEIFVVPDIGNAMWRRGTVKIGEREQLGLLMDHLSYSEYFKAVLNSSKKSLGNKAYSRMLILDPNKFYKEEFKTYNMGYTRNANTKSFEWETIPEIKDDNGEVVTPKSKKIKGLTDDRTENQKKFPIMVRHQLVTDHQTFQICTPLPSHLMGLNRVLPTKMHIEFSFYPQKKDFYFLSKNGTVNVDDYEIEILDMFLTCHILKCHPKIIAAHEQEFQTKRTVIPFQATDIIVGQAQTGVSGFRFKPWSGICPKQVIVGIVNQTAFDGSKEESPFNFEHLDAEYSYIQIGHKTIPHDLIETDFNERKIQQQYMFNQMNLGLMYDDHASLIDLDDYNSEHTINAFFLTPNGHGLWYLYKNIEGECEIVYKLRTALTEPKRIVCLGVFDRMLRIDKYRNAEVYNI